MVLSCFWDGGRRSHSKETLWIYQHIDGLNEAIAQGIFIEKDIWLMAYHPDDEPSDIVYTEDDFLSVVDTDYAMIFIQRLMAAKM